MRTPLQVRHTTPPCHATTQEGLDTLASSLLALICAVQRRHGRLGGSSARMVNNLIDWARPAACREDAQDQPERGMTLELVAVSGLHHLAADSMVLAAAEQPTRDAARDTKDPTQLSRFKASASDTSLVVPVIASPAEILRARELRQQLMKRYLNRPSEPCCPWCVGVD